MANDQRVSELLDELHDSGLRPEDLCRDRPELLPELRDRWRRLRRLEAELDSLFPPEREEPDHRPGSSFGAANVPTIPGYELEGLLGRGGMGVVFRARQVRLDRVVAIKLAIAGAYAAPHERERLQREARAVAALRHTNVVQVYDIGESEGRTYFTMEFIEGGSLAEREKPTTPRRAASLLLPLAGALQAAHAAGIIHRDLKPGNILIDKGGNPKIGDFGLSRRIDDAASLTLHGAVVGTPSYMAPEQAAGDHAALGASVDIYSLGAILYELLTGRPPFLCRSPADTIHAVINTDPPPPSRVNAKIPRDIEIICLKCLSKDPARRYPSAESLGEDLRRFLDGEAIVARPEGRATWLLRRASRNPIFTAMLVSIVLLAAVLTGGGLWFAADRAERSRRNAAEAAANERATENDLREMNRAMARRAWGEARAAFERAAGRLGRYVSSASRKAFDRGRSDLEMVARLEAIRMGSLRTIGGQFDQTRTCNAYERAFRDFEIGRAGEAPEVVASRIKSSHARLALVDALDAWGDSGGAEDWILRVARLAAVEESAWAAEARDPIIRRSRSSLERLIAAAPFGGQSVALMVAIAGDYSEAGGDAMPFRTRIQQAWPGDFWANYVLGDELVSAGSHAEAIRYLQAAVAIRPDSAVGYQKLGYCLASAGRQAEAVEYNRAALRIDPDAHFASFNLAVDLRESGQIEKAIEQLESSLSRDPKNALLHLGMADTLATASRHAEAISEYRRAAAINPRLAGIQQRLSATLVRVGHLKEARASWRSAIDDARQDFEVLDGYAELCLFLGETDDYQDMRRALLSRFEDVDDPRIAERAGRTCLMLPDTPEGTARASALIDRALAAPPSRSPKWSHPYFLFAKGLAEYRLGHFDNTIAILRGDASQVLGPCPRIISAMAWARMGMAAKADEALAEAVRSYDWNAPNDSREAWIYVILRREAESVVQSQERDREVLKGGGVPNP